MNPNTGALLAVANWPQVNANDPAASSQAALEDRAVGFDYEPGSTFKAFTVSGALQQGLITPSTPFNIPDQIQVADRTIHDDTEHADETLTTAEILAQSSNVGAIQIGMREGAPSFNSWVHRFGFGTPTGVELPGEEQGVTLPLAKYSGSSMGNLPIGQGELVTPMQMVAAYSAIANGGILRRPHIIGAVDGRPRMSPRAPRDLADDGRGAAHDARGRAGPGGHGERGLGARVSAGGQDGHGQQDRPRNGRILQIGVRRVVRRLRARV